MNATSPSVAVAALLSLLPLAPAQQQQGITADGSSTVAPITSAVVAELQKTDKNVNVQVGTSGTSGGFRRFLAGETDLSNASRAIKKEEIAKAEAAKIEYIENLVGFDGLTVAVAKNTAIFGKDKPMLTFGELELLWCREAEGIVTNWRHLGSRFPDAKITLSGAASTSGTFNFFTEVVNHKDGDTRSDYFATEEDQLLAEQTGKDTGALTYFGYAFYLHNQERVQPVAIDRSRTTIDAPAEVLAKVNEKRIANRKKPIENGRATGESVLPDVDTISTFTYPLTRPLFVYVNRKSADRPEVAAFMAYYLDEKRIGNREFMLDVGYVPAQAKLRAASRAIMSGKITGSAFAGEFGHLTANDIADKYGRHAKLAAAVEANRKGG